MPKVNLNNLAVVHSCPHCPKRFAAITTVYSHVRNAHGKSYSVARGALSVRDQTVDDRSRLKKDFVNELITLEEYQEGIEKLKQVTPLDMNLTPFLDHSLKPCLTYLLRDPEKFQKIGKIVKSGNVLDLLQEVYKGQVKIEDGEISYWNGKEVVTKDYTDKNIRSLYGSVADAYSLYYMEKANAMVSDADSSELDDDKFYQVQTYLTFSHDIQALVVSRNILVNDSLLGGFSELGSIQA